MGQEQERVGARPASPVSLADRLLDEVLPRDFDWRHMVRTYPLPVLAAAAAGGFFLARQHGTELLAALSSFADREVTKNVDRLLGEARGE